MSVSPGLNRLVAIGCAAAVVLVAVLVVTTRDSEEGGDAAPALVVRTPTKDVDVIDSATPAQSANRLARRLFVRARTVVVVDDRDPDARTRGIRAATRRGVPVLVSDSTLPSALTALGVETMLTSGRVRPVDGVRSRPVADVSPPTAEGHRVDAIVVTRSRRANVVAVASARIAGATVIEIPSGDPRTSTAAAKKLRSRPDAPVIALGRPFARGFAYALEIVRNDVEQPTGGYLALPGKHYTAMYGHPGAPQLGVLGEQGVKASVRRVERLARKYRRVSDATFVPTFEIIATVASAGAGRDGNYSNEVSVAELRPMVDAAEEAGISVILDLQPGRTDFLTQAKQYRSLLERPHVGLALDPEWRLEPKQKHLRQIGSVSVAEINRTADWLAALTRRAVLPQKLFVVHQFSTSMIRGRSELDTGHAELATVIHVDGSGPQAAKQGTWKLLHENAPDVAGWGWKNFVDEDDPMLDVGQTWRRVRPRPDLVTYQ